MWTNFDELLNVDMAHEETDDFKALKNACVIVFDTMQGLTGDVIRQSLYGSNSPYLKGLLEIIKNKFGRIELKSGTFTIRYAYPLKKEVKTATSYAFNRVLTNFFVEVLTPFQNVIKTAYLQTALNPVTDTSPTTPQAGEFGIFTVKRHANSYTNKNTSAQRSTSGQTQSNNNTTEKEKFSAFVSESERTDARTDTNSDGTATSTTSANDTMTDHGDAYTGETIHNPEFLQKIDEFLNTSPAFKKIYAAFDAALIKNPESYDVSEIGGYCSADEWYFW